jgi:shikimate dehydrogenase
VVGQPVAHSLSPVLHGAAYQALGLSHWRYDRIDCAAEELPALVAGLGPEWAGLSVTMPGKRAALELAADVTGRAAAVGAANTLVPIAAGWRADCTDVDGVAGALTTAGGYRPHDGATGVLFGAGGTARAALAALAELAVYDVTLVVRDPARAADAASTAEQVGVKLTVRRWSATDLGALAAGSAVLISTVPAGAADAHANQLAEAPCLLDVVYHPWPTPLALAAQRRGRRLGTGLDMLLHQAFGQVEQFTGRPAPRQAMRDALRTAHREATGTTLPLPLR